MRICVLAFGPDIVRDSELLDAVLTRIGELAAEGAVAIVCPTPMVLAERLARSGYRALVAAGTPDAGFVQAIASIGAITVLNGVQRDAIELAQDLENARAIVYTDSAGIMSADPQHISGAVPVRYASHVELMELAEQRLTPISGDAAREASLRGVSYEIRNVSGEGGTIVRSDGYEDRSSPVTSIAVSSGYALVSMRAPSGSAASWLAIQMRLLERIFAEGVSIEMMQSFPLGLRFLLTSRHLTFVRGLAQESGLACESVEACAKLCVVGTGVRSTAGLFYRALRALGGKSIPVLHWADSNVTLSLVVKETVAGISERCLHEALAPGSGLHVSAPIGFDADAGVVRVRGREKKLGSRQAQLLRFLMDNVGRIIEAEELARHLFGSDGKEELAAVRVHLHNLRKKIEDDPDTPRYIVTVPDQGYVFAR